MKKKRFKLNTELQCISVLMHRRTGYSLQQAILEMRDNGENRPEDYPTQRFASMASRQLCADFFNFNSDHWGWFIDFLDYACI